MKIVGSLSAFFLVLTVVSVSATELIHKSIVDGLIAYKHLSPIISQDSTYHGFVATDSVDDKIDIYNASGVLSNSIELVNSARMAIARISHDNDTLIIYILEDSLYERSGWYASDIFIITMIRIAGEHISSEILVPDCFPADGNTNPRIYGSLRFEFDDKYEPTSIVFRASLTYSAQEMTMGTRTSRVNTYIGYNLGLSKTLIRTEAENYVSGFFGGSDICGYAESDDTYFSVNDDPWNSYTSSGTVFGIYNCGDTLGRLYSESGRSSNVFAGDFVPSNMHDEIIYSGSAYDFLGLREGNTAHMVCYSMENNTLTEEWWIPHPWKFQAQFYLNSRNAIVGIVNGLSVNLLGCETGTYMESFPLDHIMYNKSFLMMPGEQMPYLFGQLGDTVFIYDLDTPTDVNSDEGNVIPNDFVLFQNYPNPFNPTTLIAFSLPKASYVTLRVYNVLGREVTSLADGRYPAGNYTVEWGGEDDNGNTVSSGLYLYKIETEDYSKTRKMVLLK